MHLQEMNRLGLALLMGHGETSGQCELSPKAPPPSTLFNSSHTPAIDSGSRDSKESACFRIGARVIQPPVIV
jgi:hypothetical protein